MRLKTPTEVMVEAVCGCALASLIPAGLWYCVDDTLARLVGNPAIGELSLWFVYPMSWLVSLVRTNTQLIDKRKEDRRGIHR